MGHYKVVATYGRARVVFVVEAKNGRQATAKARHEAKGQGMNRILVNSVREFDEVVIEFAPLHEAPLTALGGTCDVVDWSTVYAGMARPHGVPVLSVDQINARIEEVRSRFVFFVPKPERSPLIAYELVGRVFIDDGVSGRQELYERSPFELAFLLYEWSVYVGCYSDEFDQFVEEIWVK